MISGVGRQPLNQKERAHRNKPALRLFGSAALFFGAEFERQVQWAKANQTGRQEYPTQNQQDNSQRAAYYTGKIQHGENSRYDNTNNAIRLSHICFHLILQKSMVEFSRCNALHLCIIDNQYIRFLTYVYIIMYSEVS